MTFAMLLLIVGLFTCSQTCATAADDSLLAGFGNAPLSIPRSTTPSPPQATSGTSKRNILIGLIGSHRAQQFPQLGRGDIESHCEDLARGLHERQISFITFAPRIINNPDQITYPFQNKIYNMSTETKNVDNFFVEIKETIHKGKISPPDILWSFGDISVANLLSLNIPMIVTNSQSIRPHVLKRVPHVWYRFVNDESWGKWLALNPWLNDPTSASTVVGSPSKLVIHSNRKEIERLMEVSHRLLHTAKQTTTSIPIPITTTSTSITNNITVTSTAAPLLPSTATSVVSSWFSSKPSVDKNLQPPTLITGRNVLIRNTTSKSIQYQQGFVVASMTAIPKRLTEIKGHFGATLSSILSQATIDRLYLNIPWAYGIRKKSENVVIPDALLSFMENSNGRLRILRSIDYGPATKLLPTLLLPDDELPQNSIIITFDDDRIYTKNCINTLIHQAVQRPNTVITVAAWPISILSSNGKRGKQGGPNFYSTLPSGKEGIQYLKSGPIDLILGFYGVAYRKHFFYKSLQIDPLLFSYAKRPEFATHCTYVDDIWFSGHLERLRVPRYVIGKVDDSKAGVTPLTNVDALSLDQGESVKQNHDNVLCAEAMRKEWAIWAKHNRRRQRRRRR